MKYLLLSLLLSASAADAADVDAGCSSCPVGYKPCRDCDSQCRCEDVPFCCCRTETFPDCDGECLVCPSPPLAMPSYDCDVTPTSSGVCIENMQGSGAFPSYTACRNNPMCASTPDRFYKCEVNQTFTGCVEMRPARGLFPSFGACNTSCVPTELPSGNITSAP
jgi:hypothetical protein